MNTPHAFIAARAAPPRPRGVWHKCREHLWPDVPTGLASALLACLLISLAVPLVDWAFLRAVWQPQVQDCRAEQAGACWGVVAEKFRFILLGRFPQDESWRALSATGLLLGLVALSALRALWKAWLPLLWVAVLAVFALLMGGGMAGLSAVSTDRWGGLPLTLLLSTVSIVLAFPLAVLVALGRCSELPALRSVCTVYVELVRGVPLVSVLFMASFLFPLFMPQGLSIDVLVRVLAGITLFAAAYMAEVVRAGLQSVPKGQTEAAATLGLNYWQTQTQVVLPQALTIVLPGLVNNVIGIFKDTSLVTIVSLYELTGSLSLALNSDADWRPFKLEAYVFIALIYFVFCFALSRYSLHVERQRLQSQR